MFCYVTKSDTNFQKSEGHPNLKSKGKPQTSKVNQNVTKKDRKRGPGTSKFAKTKKRTRLTSTKVADLLQKIWKWWWSFKCKLTHRKGKGKRISWTSLLQDLVKQYASWLKQPGNKWRMFVCYQRRVARMCQASATDQWYWGMVTSCWPLEKVKYLGINLSQQQKMLRLLKTVVWHDGTHEKYF